VLKLRTVALPIRREDLEYPTENVSLGYLASINKVAYGSMPNAGGVTLTLDNLTDKTILSITQPNASAVAAMRFVNRNNHYLTELNTAYSASDHRLARYITGTRVDLASEPVNIDNSGQALAGVATGSTLKSLRWLYDDALNPLSLPTPSAILSATDATLATGRFGVRFINPASPHGAIDTVSAYLLSPLSELPPARAILEVEVEGLGSPDDPYRPKLSQNLVDIPDTAPEFLKREAKRYQKLKAKKYTDEEIKELLGYIPQHQIDVDAITWGAFEFLQDSPTNIIIVTGGNPHNEGAIERQKEKVKAHYRTPRSYEEAVELYNQLKREHPEWLAGKDNFIYQALGLEVYEPLAVIDFYYGNLVEHRTHISQFRSVPDWELRRTLALWRARLEQAKPSLPLEEYDSHRAKLREVLKVGW